MARKNLITVALAAVVLYGLPWGGQARGALIDNMEGYWQFDNPANRGEDSSVNGRDLTIFGGPSFTRGLFGQALDLRKDNSKYAARTVDDDAFDFGSGDFTIQIWANYHDTAGEQVVIEKFTGDGGPGWTLTKPADTFVFFAPNLVIGSGPAPLVPGVWHQLVLRRGGATVEMLLDGNSVFSYSVGTAGAVNVGDPLLIGRRNAADGRDFSTNAKLDEIAIWSRALTDQEIATLFLEGKAAAAIPEPGSACLLAVAAAGLLRRKRPS